MSAPSAPPRQVRVAISIGELIDKITILEIKAERIADPDKRRHVLAELEVLRSARTGAGLDGAEMQRFTAELKSINAALWDIEDAIREAEAQGDFGPHFIELARSVYRTNDRRARIKHRINVAYNSEIIEEKSYKGS